MEKVDPCSNWKIQRLEFSPLYSDLSSPGPWNLPAPVPNENTEIIQWRKFELYGKHVNSLQFSLEIINFQTILYTFFRTFWRNDWTAFF